MIKSPFRNVFANLTLHNNISNINFKCNVHVRQHSDKRLLDLCMDARYDVKIIIFHTHDLYSKIQFSLIYCAGCVWY